MQQHHTIIAIRKQGRAGTRRLATVLQEAGAGFVLIPPRTKAPTYKGWQRNPKPLAEAFQHAARGGNVGLLGGHNGLILLDADAHVDRVLAAEPRLIGTVRIFRRNRPGQVDRSHRRRTASIEKSTRNHRGAPPARRA